MFVQLSLRHKRVLILISADGTVEYVARSLLPLQDMSVEDCMKEGVLKGEFRNTWDKYYLYYGEGIKTFKTPRYAFATLINKISGKGTCDSNPWVWVYDFELVK